jgi:hypothetical protein
MVKLLRIFPFLFLAVLANVSPLHITAQSIPQLDLDVAEAQGLISYEAHGRGYASGAMIDLTVTNLSDSPLDVVIPPGMRFVPTDALQAAASALSENQGSRLETFYAQLDAKPKDFFAGNHEKDFLITVQAAGSQIGVVGTQRVLMFSGGSDRQPFDEVVALAHETQTTIIEAYCANAHLDNPSESTFFSAVSPPEDDLTRLMRYYSEQNQFVSLIALQIATWIITDDVDMEFLISVGYEPTTEELHEALYLLQDAGIDISNKQLGQTALPPRSPMPINPADGSTTTNPQPTLTWTSANGAVSYDVALDIVDGNPPPNIFTGYSVGTTFKPPAPLYAATYYWAVRTVNSSGVHSPWSATQSFTLLSTANSAPVQTLHTIHEPTLHWNPVTWATAYQVEISDTGNFIGYTIMSDVLSPEELSWVTDYLGNGTWFWHVRARKLDGISWGSWSTAETFLVLVP